MPYFKGDKSTTFQVQIETFKKLSEIIRFPIPFKEVVIIGTPSDQHYLNDPCKEEEIDFTTESITLQPIEEG